MSTTPTKPEYLRVNPENIPMALIDLPQWLVWRAVWRPGKDRNPGRWTKKPYQTNGQPASSTDSATWTEFGKALLAYQAGGFDGIGFAVTTKAGIVGVDLDDCVKSDGTIAPEKRRIVDRLNSYTELSPSGSGLRVFIVGKMPGGRSGRRKGPVEVYAEGRYLTVTGHVLNEVHNAIINER